MLLFKHGQIIFFNDLFFSPIYVTPTDSSNTEGKKLKFEGSDNNLQKTYYNWANTYKLQAPCLKQESMPWMCRVLAATLHFVSGVTTCLSQGAKLS